MKKFAISCFLIFTIFLSFATANDIFLTLDGKTSNAEIIHNDFQDYWSITLTPENGEVLVRMPPNYIIVENSVIPEKEVSLSNKYFFNILVSYEGKEVYYKSNEPITIKYKEMDSYEKFNNFFSLI